MITCTNATTIVGTYEEINLMIGQDASAYRSPAPSIISRSGTTNANTIMSAAAFDATTEEFLVWTLKLPINLDDEGTVTIKIPWIPATASSNSVVWKIYHKAIGTGESFDAAFSTTTVTSAGSASTDVITIASISATISSLGWAADDVLIFHISRDATNGSDTLTSDAQLLDITIQVPVTGNAGGGSGGSSVTSVDVQTFINNGTWTKPALAKTVEVFLVAGGGGGGSGRRGAASTNRFGGGGGAYGTILFAKFNASYFSLTELVTIGAGGLGGTAVTTNDTNGNNGTSGNVTQFGRIQAAAGTNRGVGGSTTSGTAGSAASWSHEGLNFPSSTVGGGGGSSGNGSSAGSVSQTWRLPTSGGGGGGINSSNVSGTGGNGGARSVSASQSGLITQELGGAGGAAAGNGTAGANGTEALTGGLGGGGGGGGAGTGGNGGFPGGGGGGGGASLNGTNSGAGGNGGNGYAVIITYL